MTIRPVRSDQDLAAARAEIARLLQCNPPAGSDEFDRLEVLVTLADSYEARSRVGRVDPIDAIAQAMGEAGISARLLAAITRIPEAELAAILGRQQRLDVAAMRVLGPALGVPLDVLMQPAKLPG